MPVDLASSINKTSQWAFSSDLLNNILGSSLILGFVISIILVIIVMLIYPAKKKYTCIYTR